MKFFDKKDNVKQNHVIDNLNLIVSSNTLNIGNLKKELEDLRFDYTHYREECNERIRKVNNLVNEKLDSQKEDFEAILISIEKKFSQKINNISDGKPIVTDLLRKIAKLEAIRDSDQNRRTTEEVLATLNGLKDQQMNNELTGAKSTGLDTKISILEWILGKTI